jgi:hypothetical protein
MGICWIESQPTSRLDSFQDDVVEVGRPEILALGKPHAGENQ